MLKLPMMTPALPTVAWFSDMVANSKNIKSVESMIKIASLKILNPFDDKLVF
ncbi:hypothetical protein [Campylobacter geochelonis]|uniref:hypothetical protein n=1 Tax=Campylobacter geochelonis TaxID=1780362 RepID=UPI000AC9E247|nr:hypothetical protein [Campylobacter geochelonis]